MASFRLWTGRNLPWRNELSLDLFKSYRRCIEAWVDAPWKGAGISFEFEAEKIDGTHFKLNDNFSVGVQLCWSWGHEVHQYDGFHNRISLGPFFVSWYGNS